MGEVSSFLLHLAYVVLGVFVLIATIKSHKRLRYTRIDTNGRKAFRIAVVMFSVFSICFGYSDMAHIFGAIAILFNQLVTYRRCQPESRLGRELSKINW